MSRDSVPTLPPGSTEPPGADDFEDVTDVDALVRRASTSTPPAEDDDTIPTLPPPPTGAPPKSRSSEFKAPSLTEIVELTGSLITRQVAEEWREAAQAEFERLIAAGVPEAQAAEEAMAKFLPIAQEPDTF